MLESPVARSVDGVTTEGRFIKPDAYALYTIASLCEAHGQWREALGLYQQALDLDGRGPELHTRIAAVACRLGNSALADAAFARAARAAPDYGPLWFELGQCRKLRRDLAGAQIAAQEALRLDPERYEASLLAADLLELRGDHAGAARLRDALATHASGDVPVQRRLLAAALRTGDRALAARSLAAIKALTERANPAERPHGMSLALTALEQGDLGTARRESEQLLSADPSNADAFVVALAAADLQQDPARFEQLLELPFEPGSSASSRVQGILSALLARRVSPGAASLVTPERSDGK